jgi:hypothetical protein
LLVEEVREAKDINYVLLMLGNEIKQTKVISPKTVADQKWDETFEL